MTTYLGVDTGGTFTDFVLLDNGSLRVHKVLSTPQAPELAILKGIREMGLDPDELKLIHGSTVATNAVLEGKGVKTVYIGNHGLGDLLTIGRQAREHLYQLQPDTPQAPVPKALCLETGGRLAADGSIVEPLSAEDLQEIRQQLDQLQPEAVAINLIFSYLDDSLEKEIEQIIPADIFVSRSSAVLPEIREYERGIATWINAWVGPLMKQYLGRLVGALPDARLSVMQSSGESVAAEQAGDHAVRLLLSGPAGGLVGARFVGSAAGCERLLSFDMGGTSTDVALLDGEPGLTSNGKIGRYPVSVPMVDMHTIGAGGGSIASIDAGGMLLVGPESAGANPGPACYGQGGARATVTDANLVLGRLRPDAFLGGEMQLDLAASRTAIEPLAVSMDCSIEEAALGIIRVADEHMVQALRVISVQRGEDPQQYTLASFGGAGGLHVCSLADSLGMKRALAPVHAGVLSALGMLAAKPGRQFSHSMIGLLDDIDDTAIEKAFTALIGKGREELASEGIDNSQITSNLSVDLRYSGQSYTLNLEWNGRKESAAAFEQLHERRYGHRLDSAVELVNIRAALHGKKEAFELGEGSPGPETATTDFAELYGVARKVPILKRSRLAPGQELTGPVLITEKVSTLWIAPDWNATTDSRGNILLEKN